MGSPLLTVVVTSYNYGRYIGSCIESILEQDFKDFELIVLDNRSVDNTADVVDKYLGDERVTLIRHEENVGAYLNFNMSLGVGAGRYLAVVSADDKLLPGHFSRMLGLLKANPSCVLAYSPIEIINADGVNQGVQVHPGYSANSYAGGRNEFADLLALDCYLSLSSVVFDRKAIKEELYFDLRSWGGADWEFYVRLAQRYGEFAFDTVPGSSYRIHDQQYSNTSFYASPEALYAHLYIVEKFSDDILALGRQQCIRIADYLRWRVAQYEQCSEHLKPRLDRLFRRLDGQAIVHRSGVLAAIGVNHALDSKALDVTTLEVIENKTCLERAHVNERLYTVLAEWVLLCADGYMPDQQEVKKALTTLKTDHSLAAVCLVDGAAVINSWEDGARVGAVVCRWQAFERVGGYDSSAIAGESVWDLVGRLLREGFSLHAQQLRAGSLPSLGVLARASVVFRNTLGKGKDELVRAAVVLLDHKESWRSIQEQILQADPACGPADFLRLLFKCRGNEFSPLFSVVVTTFNRSFLLDCALRSLAEQSFKNFEVVLVNDHGEGVESLLSKYDLKITYLRLGRNSGPAAARNKALRLAAGRYVVFLDDDDIFLPNHLQVLADGIGRNPGWVVYTDAIFIQEKIENGVRVELLRERRYDHDVYSKEDLLVNNYIPVNVFACPLNTALDVGGFDESLIGLEDWDFLMHLSAVTDFRHIRTSTVEVRMRDDSFGQERRTHKALKDYPKLYQQLYARHSDLGSSSVHNARRRMLKELGVEVKEPEVEPIQKWLAARLPTEVQSRLISERLEQAQGGVVLGVVVIDADGDQDALIATVRSLVNDRHLYASVKIVALTTLDAPATGRDEKLHYVRLDERELVEQVNDAVGSLQADWFMLVQAGSVFTQSGLMVAALDLLGAPDCRAVYGDELFLQDNDKLGVALRPGLNLDMLLSLPGVMARHWLFNRPLWQQSGGFDLVAGQAFELDYILRLILDRGLEGMGHISEPLLKSRAPLLTNSLDERDVIVRHLNARGYPQADVGATRPGHYEISYGHAQLAKVSILVSANGGLAKIRRCVESVLEKTSYPSYEVLILDHADQDQATANWLQGVEQLGTSAIKVVRLPRGLSLAQGRNMAVAQATGDYLLWLDCGVAVLSGDWLHALMNHGLRPEVGAVGAKLITGDSKVASGGIVLGLNGPAGHVGVGQPLDAAGYLQRLVIDQNHTALSGRCLLLRRTLFTELGGFDEAPEMAPWTDVDLCLRLHSAGYFNVWTPRSPLLITAEAPLAATTEQQDAMYQRWLPLLARDPVYNPNFKLDADEEFALAPSLLSWNPLSSWKPLPRVLAHPADSFGCGHYRIINPLKALNNEGVVDGTFAWGHLSLTELERFAPDSIVLQRQIDPEQIESMRRMQAFSSAFKVYELDDYLPNLPIKSVHREQMPKDILKSLRKGLGYVDRFVVSTEPLAEAFSGLHGDIRVVENRLSVEWWRGLSSRRRRGSKPRVGWAGGISHTGDLELIADVVKELAGEVEWVFFGMCPEKIRPYVHEVHNGVHIDLYPSKLASLDLDLALAPVEQNLFNECKSNLRLLEYGACGFPVVCSDVRCYQGDRLPVTRVKNRFKDWVDAIRMHISDLDATARMGDQLRQAVYSDWMLEGDKLELWRQAWMPD